jgi:hypothetical protein
MEFNGQLKSVSVQNPALNPAAEKRINGGDKDMFLIFLSGKASS